MTTEPHALHFLLHAADLVEERLRRRLAPLGIRPRQARIVDALDRMGEVSQADLARAFDVTAASMSTMTARLVQAGFIERRAHPDEQRSNLLRLSPKGRALLAEIHAAWRDVDLVIAGALGPGRAGELAGLARELRDKLGGRTPGRP